MKIIIIEITFYLITMMKIHGEKRINDTLTSSSSPNYFVETVIITGGALTFSSTPTYFVVIVIIPLLITNGTSCF